MIDIVVPYYIAWASLFCVLAVVSLFIERFVFRWVIPMHTLALLFMAMIFIGLHAMTLCGSNAPPLPPVPEWDFPLMFNITIEAQP